MQSTHLKVILKEQKISKKESQERLFSALQILLPSEEMINYLYNEDYENVQKEN